MVAVSARFLVVLTLSAGLALSGCSAPKGVRELPIGELTKTPAEKTAPFAVTTLKLPYSTCNKPQRVGRSVYAAVTPGEDGDDTGSIVRLDTGTGLVETIITAPAGRPIGWFTVNDTWLAWTVDRDLFAQPLSGGARQRLAHGRDLYAPALSGDLVAWDGLTDRRTHQIVVRNLASGETTAVGELAVADLYNNFPTWDQDRLVWTDVEDGEGRYKVYDATSGTTREYRLASGAFRVPGYAQIEGDRLYSINFDDVDEWNWSRQRLGYFSATDERFVPVLGEGVIVNSFEVANGLLAVVDHEQLLTVRSTDDINDRRVYRPVRGRVDFIEESSDGTLIAWREATDEEASCTLYVIGPR